jgi:hypothetical protein
MKKVKIFFALLLSIASLTVFGQKQLELKDTLTGKVTIFKIGKTIRYKGLEDTDFEKAKIQNITATTIVLYLPNLDEDEGKPIRELALTDIHAIQKSTTIHSVCKGVGALFMLGGAYTMASSAALAGDDGSTGEYLGIGAGMLAVGILPYLFKPKTYILRETHTARIR